MILRACQVCGKLSPGRRCPDHQRAFSKARDAGRPSSAKRGYDSKHQARRRREKRRVDTGTVPCARCGELILPGEAWDLDHDDQDRSRYIGPSHARCNRATSTHRKERA